MVAVAVKNYAKGEKGMKLAGLLFFSDTIEKGAKSTIQFIKDNGIIVKMLSGDNIAIAQRIAEDLDIEGVAENRKMLGKDFKDLTEDEFARIGTFAEILPDDKYDLVQLAQKQYIVAVTGDGINDLPALKRRMSACRKNAVDALKSTADLCLQGVVSLLFGMLLLNHAKFLLGFMLILFIGFPKVSGLS